MNMQPRSWLTLRQVAELLGVDYKTVHKWTTIGVRDRKLNSRLVGGRRRVDPDSLATFLADSPVHEQAKEDFGAAGAGYELERLLPNTSKAPATTRQSPPESDTS
jgi:excisionase family DNA binding protein